MDKVAIICCSNNDEICNSMLKSSLEKQKNIEYECLIINGGFSSAAAAFNQAVSKTDAEYLFFVHQDIAFDEQDFLYKCVCYMKENIQSILGICGTKYENGSIHTYSNIYHGLWKSNVGERISDYTEVDGLDEVLMACHRNLFMKLSFDELNFDGWHMYIADFCYQVKEIGYKVVVVPFKTIHKNEMELPGYFWKYKILPDDYFIYMKRIWKKYRKKYSRINTPCVNFSTNFFGFYCKFFKTKLVAKRRNKYRKLSVK